MAYDQVVSRRAKMKISSVSRDLASYFVPRYLFPFPEFYQVQFAVLETLILFPSPATVGFVVETCGFVEVTGSCLDPVKRFSPSFRYSTATLKEKRGMDIF